MSNLRLDGIGRARLGPTNAALRKTSLTNEQSANVDRASTTNRKNAVSNRNNLVYIAAVATTSLALMIGVVWYFSKSTSAIFSGQVAVPTSQHINDPQAVAPASQIQAILDNFSSTYGVKSGIVVIFLLSLAGGGVGLAPRTLMLR